jgi:quinolinate synthase
MAHLECKGPVLAVADVKGSTATMLNYAQQSDQKQFIVATEAGILHEMQRTCPDKEFIPVPPESSETVGCHCNECAYMRMNTMEKLYNCLKYEWPEIMIDKQTIDAAVRPINEMLGLSAKLGL